MAAHQRPLTFVLGAGATLSSGAPTTPAVHAKLEKATQMRLGALIRERLHMIVDEEVRDQLQPLFEHVVPNTGYRVLAALGRDRRINIINLNWDDAAERACRDAGVSCAVFDPLDGPTLIQVEATLPPAAGVLIVHVHGTLANRPRYSLLETLPNQPALWAAIRPLLGTTTIICGASLAGDSDVDDVVKRLSGVDSSGPPVWMFARSANEPRVVDFPAQWTRVFSHDVDFDELVAVIAEEVWGSRGVVDARWDDLVRRIPQVWLPRSTNLVELNARTRRALFDARVGALVARPHAGKTVGALRLAHLRLLIEAPDAELRLSLDQQDSAAELSLAATQEGIVLFIDDPFGQSRPSDNPRVVDYLAALASYGDSWAYVSSRDSNWTRYAGPLQAPVDGLAVASRQPEQWYEHKDLLRLAGGTAFASRARRAVHAEQATTPPEVIEAGRRGRVLSPAERLKDARAMLEQDRLLAAACVLVRLQELRSAPVPDAELAAIIGADPHALPGAQALLYAYEMDGRTYWAFVHPTGRQVTDGYLVDHHEEVERQLLGGPVVPIWVRRHLNGWRLQHGLMTDVHDALGTEALAPGDWLTERLATSPTERLLREIAELSIDEWATIELAYELVRMWDGIEEMPGAEMLLRSILGRPMGTYAVLEGCLYYQLGADDELWAQVSARLWELNRDPSATFERLLALDAVLWRDPRHEPVRAWAKRALDNLGADQPAFAFVRFAAGYHPDGMASLGAEGAVRRDAHLTWSEAQAQVAARLVAWHFAHQSRARAMLHRYTHHEKQWLCQTTYSGDVTTSPAALTLARGLLGFESTVGWCFHLLCNLAAVSGLDLADVETRDIAEEALRKACRSDSGVISAALAYQPADAFRDQLRARAEDLDESDCYLDALSTGVIAGETRVGPPRFRYIHDPSMVLKTLALDPNDLDPRLAGLAPSALAERLWRAAARVMSSADLGQRREVAHRIGCVERGDLRTLTHHARGGHSGDPFEAIVENWRKTIPSDGPENLFP